MQSIANTPLNLQVSTEHVEVVAEMPVYYQPADETFMVPCSAVIFIGKRLTVNTHTAPDPSGRYLMTGTIVRVLSPTSFVLDCKEPYFGYDTFSAADIVDISPETKIVTVYAAHKRHYQK